MKWVYGEGGAKRERSPLHDLSLLASLGELDSWVVIVLPTGRWASSPEKFHVVPHDCKCIFII